MVTRNRGRLPAATLSELAATLLRPDPADSTATGAALDVVYFISLRMLRLHGGKNSISLTCKNEDTCLVHCHHNIRSTFDEMPICRGSQAGGRARCRLAGKTLRTPSG